MTTDPHALLLAAADEAECIREAPHGLVAELLRAVALNNPSSGVWDAALELAISYLDEEVPAPDKG